jgi:hypothetical protein
MLKGVVAGACCGDRCRARRGDLDISRGRRRHAGGSRGSADRPDQGRPHLRPARHHRSGERAPVRAVYLGSRDVRGRQRALLRPRDGDRVAGPLREPGHHPDRGGSRRWDHRSVRRAHLPDRGDDGLHRHLTTPVGRIRRPDSCQLTYPGLGCTCRPSPVARHQDRNHREPRTSRVSPPYREWHRASARRLAGC